MAFHFDSPLLRNTFGTPEMRSIFDDDAFIETFMTVEAALARAEARAGIIPSDAAGAISDAATIDHLNRNRLTELVADTGHTAMSIIGAWRDTIGEEGEYIHWGATTQDIIDTTFILQLRRAIEIVERDVTAIRDNLAALAEDHADTPMMGRTHYVHATPITLGLKIAVWIDELDRHLDRLDQLTERAFVLQFFGATGTLASLGDDGPTVQRYLADELDLALPDVCWQPARDRVAEAINLMATISTSIGKIANTILFLNRPEVQEVQEAIPTGAIGSSTMPHKRNPKKSETIVGLATMVRAYGHAMNELSETIDERSASTWYMEFAIIPETFLLTGRLLANARDLTQSLEVNPDRMADNMEIFGGLVASERVMMALAEDIGRQTAHDVVYDAAMEALTSDREFIDILLDEDQVTASLSRDDLAALTDPTTYTGLAAQFTDTVVSRHR